MNRTAWLALISFLLPLEVAQAQLALPATTPPTNAPAVPVRPSVAPLPFLVTRLDPAMDSLLAPDVKLDTIVTIPNLASEGPQWRDGKLWVSDQRSGRIYAISTDGNYSVVMENAGGPIDPNIRVQQGPNGEITAQDGGALIARQGLRDIGHLDRNGVMSSFISDFGGKKFNSPNDMVYSPDGTLWFTDPPFSLPGFSAQNLDGPPPPAKQLPYQAVFRYKDGKLAPVITDMFSPNGIGVSPDGKTLYVDNTMPEPYIRAYDIGSDGSLSHQRELYRFESSSDFARGVPDGLKIDSRGNVWMTGPGGINIISPEGKLLGRIQLPFKPSNVAFGEDLHSVFFASGSTIFHLHTLVTGEKPMYYRR